ncbi:hypothetical protein L0F63_003403 [Massospora cicadina]|nr:hypothetical protein L0F63_003403 [Massospora cicadina]
MDGGAEYEDLDDLFTYENTQELFKAAEVAATQQLANRTPRHLPIPHARITWVGTRLPRSIDYSTCALPAALAWKNFTRQPGSKPQADLRLTPTEAIGGARIARAEPVSDRISPALGCHNRLHGNFVGLTLAKPGKPPPLTSGTREASFTGVKSISAPQRFGIALERLKGPPRPPTPLLQTLELSPTFNFLCEAIGHWERITNRAPNLMPRKPVRAIGPLRSKQPPWRLELLQRIASEVGPSRPVLEALHETLQLLFMPIEQHDGHAASLTSSQLAYQSALVELRNKLVLGFNYPSYRSCDLPSQLHPQFRLDKLEVLRRFGECLVRAEGLGRFKDIGFLLDIMLGAAQILPSLFGDSLIGQRGLSDGILLPLCAVIAKFDAPEEGRDASPIELASQIPDRAGSGPGRPKHRAPPPFVVASILQFLKLVMAGCPPACLGWFGCLLDANVLLALLSCDRVALQDKLTLVSMLTRLATSPKVQPLLVQGRRNSVQCLSELLEWGLNHDLGFDELCDLGEGILGYVYTLILESTACLSAVFGYGSGQPLRSSILFPLVAFVTRLCDAQGPLLFELLKEPSFPRLTRSQRPLKPTLDTRVANYGSFFRPLGCSNTHELDRTVKLIELFLLVMEIATNRDVGFYDSLRKQAWIRTHPFPSAVASCLDGMNLNQCQFDLLTRLMGYPTEKPPEDLGPLDELIRAASPTVQGGLYLTEQINDLADGVLKFSNPTLRSQPPSKAP